MDKPERITVRSSIKLKLSPEEIQRFKIDPEFAKRKVQEAKDAALANDLNVSINASKENVQPTEPLLSNTNNNQEIHPLKWCHEAILLLVEEYRVREVDFTSGRISQKKLWEIISMELLKNGHAVTGPQCMSKYNGLKKTYKSVKDHNGKSGNGSKAWTYFDLMHNLIGKKPYIAPVATISSTGKRCRTESETSDDTDSGCRTQKRKTLTQINNKDIVGVLQMSKQIAEENRERRHKEKMEQKNRSIALLEKILDRLEK